MWSAIGSNGVEEPHLGAKLEGRVERDQHVGTESLSMPGRVAVAVKTRRAYSHIRDRASEQREFVVGIIPLGSQGVRDDTTYSRFKRGHPGVVSAHPLRKQADAVTVP